MSDTASAIKSAREVQADTLTPELFRQASEWFNLARREFKYKNFNLATEYAQKAKEFAEEAEFEAIRGGAVREATPEPTQETPKKSTRSAHQKNRGGRPPTDEKPAEEASKAPGAPPT